jgi:AraC-like DNA-binding protein
MNNQYKYLLGEGLYPALDGFEILLSNQLGILFPKNQIALPEGTHVHSSYEFVIPISLIPGLRLERKKINLEQEKIFPFNPEQAHGTWHPIEKTNFFALQIDKEFLQEVSRQICGQKTIYFNNENFVFDTYTLNLVNKFIDEARNRQMGYDYVLESLSTQIVVDLIRKVKSNLRLPEIHHSNKVRENIKKAINFLMDSYNREFSLNDIAREANLSPYYFVRVFKTETGKTPYEYLVNLRIKKASVLLRRKENNITQISYLCGFSNPSHFSSVFKRIIGVSPSEYRKEVQE